MLTRGDRLTTACLTPVRVYDGILIKGWETKGFGDWVKYDAAYGNSRVMDLRFFDCHGECLYTVREGPRNCIATLNNGCIKCQFGMPLKDACVKFLNERTEWHECTPYWHRRSSHIYRFRMDPVPWCGKAHSGKCKNGNSGNGLLFASLKRAFDAQVLDYDSDDEDEILFMDKASKRAWRDSGMYDWDPPHWYWQQVSSSWKRTKCRKQWAKHLKK